MALLTKHFVPFQVADYSIAAFATYQPGRKHYYRGVAAEHSVDVGGGVARLASVEIYRQEYVLQRFDGRKYVVDYEMYVGSIGRGCPMYHCDSVESAKRVVAHDYHFCLAGSGSVPSVVYFTLRSRNTASQN